MYFIFCTWKLLTQPDVATTMLNKKMINFFRIHILPALLEVLLWGQVPHFTVQLPSWICDLSSLNPDEASGYIANIPCPRDAWGTFYRWQQCSEVHTLPVTIVQDFTQVHCFMLEFCVSDSSEFCSRALFMPKAVFWIRNTLNICNVKKKRKKTNIVNLLQQMSQRTFTL